MIQSPNIDPMYNPNLENAIKAYPFEPLIDKYARFEYPLDSDHLDELVGEIMASSYLKQLEADLAKRPHLSALYRYDPFTMSSSETWAGQIPNGPKKAWLRVFKDLSFDDVYVAKTDTEALVVINRPSVLVTGINKASEVSEPTVLFSSDVLGLSGYNIGEQDTLGMTFTHGDVIHEVLPEGELKNASIVLGYYAHDRAERQKPIEDL